LSAIVLPFAVAGTLIPLRDDVAEADVALALAIVIVVAATLGGRPTGTTAGVAAAVAFDAFFTRPYYSLRIDQQQDIETVLLMVVLGGAIGEIVTRGRRSHLAWQTARSQLERASRITELAAGGERPGRLIRVARSELIDILDLEGCEFERPPFVDALPRLTHTGLLFPPRLGELEPPPHDHRLALPVTAEGLEIGRFVLTLAPERSPLDLSHDARIAALLLADQLGVVLRAYDR
jgi:Osmosensitive K+ channel histidine kinase